ncbi:MAG: ankyrin repeat domain-containing protein [Thermofilaceae archaeon]
MSELHKAAYEGDLQRVKKLIEKGADVNARDNEGRTPLYYAAVNGRLEVARLLLEKGADVNARDDKGETPLLLAVNEGHLEVARLLLEKGADVNARDNYRLTPLHYAAFGGDVDAARLLVEKGADVNAKNDAGWTPLHAAACNGHLDFVRFLLEAGANPTLRDNEGWTPADLAREQGHGDVAELIEGWAGGRVRGVQAGLIASVEVGGLVEGEWGVLRVQLNRPSTLVVEGDVDWLDPGLVEGVVEVPVKARKAGRMPVAIVAKSSGKEERKVVWVEVSRGVCPSCKAPIEPGAKYCWKCGAYLA